MIIHRYMDLYMTLRTGMEHLMFKATWYGSAEAVAKYGKNTASDKQKICAEYISQLLVPKMQRIVQLHDPLGREDIKHYAQFAFGGALVAKIGLLTALKTARPLFPRLERVYQTCSWGAGFGSAFCWGTIWSGHQGCNSNLTFVDSAVPMDYPETVLKICRVNDDILFRTVA